MKRLVMHRNELAISKFLQVSIPNSLAIFPQIAILAFICLATTGFTSGFKIIGIVSFRLGMFNMAENYVFPCVAYLKWENINKIT